MTKSIEMLLTVMLGSAVGASIIAINKHKNEMSIHDKVNNAAVIETYNPEGARPWDYCRNENPENIPKGDAFYDACLQRLYQENKGLKEGRHLLYINAIDIDGDGKVSSKY